jgi:HAMP domain-containing protein
MTLVLAAPALPLHTAGPYVAAAYIVFVALILIYVVIMARRLSRTQRELRDLRRQLELKQPEQVEPAVRETPRGSERPQERIA